ncbi:MAG: hypothetical protein KAT34_10165 [Candidatus Aminicenantes bacterium]|nr:hypothetical protein [Candidatus Aminicenantes bacterium]
MSAKNKTKKVLYNVQCIHNEKHIFKKVFEINEGTEKREETEVETYCPSCDKLVTVTVKGKVKPDITRYRSGIEP